MSNPILNDKFTERTTIIEGATMTVNGTLQAAMILGLLVLAAASFVWSRFGAGYTDFASLLTYGGAIAGFIVGLIVCFTRNKYLTPVYAVCEGCFLGGVSFMFEAAYPGIVLQAVIGTFAALFSMLGLYRMGLIKCTDKFRSVIFIATLSIAVIYLINFIGSFFHYAVPFVNAADNSNMGIIVTGVIVVIAALNLILDFDFIEKGSQMMLPKDMEWYGAFGLMVTIIWLYIEILKLLAKAKSRR